MVIPELALGEDALVIHPHPMRETDLAWWAELAPTLNWTWAKTYAQSAPHSYVVKGKNISAEDYERLFKMIYEYGQPRQFYNRVNIELDMPDVEIEIGPRSARETHTGYKFWPMTDLIEESIIINMAPIGMVYGKQTVPSTDSHLDSVYDELAFVYDQRYDDEYCHEENLKVWKIVCGDRYIEDLLDVGAGTGLALDLNMVRRATGAYRAIDPSRGMLNRLLFKHNWVRDVHPMTAEGYLTTDAAGRDFNTVISLFGSPSYIRPEAIAPLAERATQLAVFMHYVDGYFPDYHDETSAPSWAQESRLAAAELPGAQVAVYHKFQVTVVRR